ncbi:putative methyltransferase PMT13 [Camellia lanceoleosa]|uniref:Methyltransferase PMT13 n=1 Tax=Camellia lanceoleosa TaxID=1840588 RepID=A0ACC0GA35_9ERIC|nr:putative methyltransferase PMT13 [Camellia lanceoleosa]
MVGYLNLPLSKTNPRQWHLLDLVSATMLLFFLFIFSSLGDSLTVSGTQALLRSSFDPKQRLGVPTAGERELAIESEDDVFDEVRVASEEAAREAVGSVFLGEVLDYKGVK